MDDVLVCEPLFAEIAPLAAEHELVTDWSALHEETNESRAVMVDAADEGQMMSGESKVAHCSDTTNNGSQDTATTRRKRTAPPETSESATAPPISARDRMKRSTYKKKSTYVIRKEKKRELVKEMEALQQQLRDLEAPRVFAKEALAASARDNTLLRETVREQQLSLATSQSVVTRLLSNPLSNTWIRLGTDWDDRRKTLLETKDRAISHACEYVGARSRFLDSLKRHFSEDRFETGNGDFCCARYDVRQFFNVSSVKQVYDAVVSYLLNIEISVSERLGDITTRDDFDLIENSIVNFRFLTTEFGVPLEKQGVLFMEYFDSHDLSQGEPCGVIVTDRVEEDELYPYTPQERMRKDSSVTIVLTPHWRVDNQGGKELVVTMSMGKFIKLHHSECPLAIPEAVEQMRENVMGWGSVMSTRLHDILYRSPQ